MKCDTCHSDCYAEADRRIYEGLPSSSKEKILRAASWTDDVIDDSELMEICRSATDIEIVKIWSRCWRHVDRKLISLEKAKRLHSMMCAQVIAALEGEFTKTMDLVQSETCKEIRQKLDEKYDRERGVK